jgi:hypothetical protein
MRFARTALLRPITIDTAVASVLGMAAVMGALVEDLDPDAGAVRPLDAWAVLLILGMTLPLVARRLLPRAVAIVTVCCLVAAVVIGYPIGIGPFGTLFALWSLAFTTSRRDTLLVLQG